MISAMVSAHVPPTRELRLSRKERSRYKETLDQLISAPFDTTNVVPTKIINTFVC